MPSSAHGRAERAGGGPIRVAGRLPTFLIAGVPKAGTSALASWLAAHPEVFIPPEKELHYFTRGYGRGVDWYRRCFAAAGTAAAVGEASPGYLSAEAALPRIHELLPDVRLIAILRHPVDRAYSHYWMQRSKFPDRRSFEEIVRTEMRDPSAKIGKPHLRYLGLGRYIDHLERACERFPRTALHVLLFDDLRDDPRSAFDGVCRFLGVDPSWVPPTIGEVVNPTTMVRSEALRSAMIRWRLGRRLPRALVTWVDRLNRTDPGYPLMEPHLRAELLAWYDEPNAALARWLGRDLSAWGA